MESLETYGRNSAFKCEGVTTFYSTARSGADPMAQLHILVFRSGTRRNSWAKNDFSVRTTRRRVTLLLPLKPLLSSAFPLSSFRHLLWNRHKTLDKHILRKISLCSSHWNPVKLTKTHCGANQDIHLIAEAPAPPRTIPLVPFSTSWTTLIENSRGLVPLSWRWPSLKP